MSPVQRSGAKPQQIGHLEDSSGLRLTSHLEDPTLRPTKVSDLECLNTRENRRGVRHRSAPIAFEVRPSWPPADRRPYALFEVEAHRQFKPSGPIFGAVFVVWANVHFFEVGTCGPRKISTRARVSYSAHEQERLT